MRKNIYKTLLFIIGIVLFTACANEDELSSEQKGKVILDATQFTLTEETYGKELAITRADDFNPKTETYSLGNGVEAEVTLEREKRSNQQLITRAQEIDNQHYTIKVYDNPGSLVGTLKGTVAGVGATKAFTPDAGTPKQLVLSPDTYTFVCFNDKVEFNNNKLTVTDSNAGQALIGRTQVAVSGNKYQVHFDMKHQAARVRFEMTTYWDIVGITANIQQTASDPAVLTYNADATNPQYVSNTSSINKHYTFPNKTVEASDYTYTSVSDYQYYLPSSKGNSFKLIFQSGNLYEKSLANKLMTFDKFPRTQLAANESYIVKIKLYYTYQYLFQDGTTGTLLQGKAAGKTPIGACTQDKRAIALKSVGIYNWSNTRPQWDNQGHSENINDHKYVTWGWELTYNANQSYDNSTVKANEQNRYSAFYLAAHYNPGVPTTNLGHWYLPSLGEVLDAYHAIGHFDKSSITGSWGDYNKDWNWKIYRVVFVQAGGAQSVGEWFWTSEEYNAEDAVNCGCSKDNGGYIRISSYHKNEAKNFVRPFIKYN